VTRPLTHIRLRAILRVLQIGIKAEAKENQVKNVLLDYNHFQNIALVQKGLYGTFMHTFMHMLVVALVDTIMTDSKDLTVTYTTVSSPCEGRSGDVSPGVDGPPVIPEDPYAYVVAGFQALPPPDYVPGLEEPKQAPPSPVYIPYVPMPGRQTEIFQRVKALVDDRQYHYVTGRLVDQEARFSQEAWAHSMRLGSAIHFELQGYMTHTWVQDQRIDAHDTLIATLTTQLSSLQGHLATALGEIRALQA
nr:hypothetical protein [Tanacetum cinerariifolium]